MNITYFKFLSITFLYAITSALIFAFSPSKPGLEIQVIFITDYLTLLISVFTICGILKIFKRKKILLPKAALLFVFWVQSISVSVFIFLSDWNNPFQDRLPVSLSVAYHVLMIIYLVFISMFYFKNIEINEISKKLKMKVYFCIIGVICLYVYFIRLDIAQTVLLL